MNFFTETEKKQERAAYLKNLREAWMPYFLFACNLCGGWPETRQVAHYLRLYHKALGLPMPNNHCIAKWIEAVQIVRGRSPYMDQLIRKTEPRDPQPAIDAYNEKQKIIEARDNDWREHLKIETPKKISEGIEQYKREQLPFEIEKAIEKAIEQYKREQLPLERDQAIAQYQANLPVEPEGTRKKLREFFNELVDLLPSWVS